MGHIEGRDDGQETPDGGKTWDNIGRIDAGHWKRVDTGHRQRINTGHRQRVDVGHRQRVDAAH